MQKFNHKTDPNKLYLPNQMPMFAGSPGYLNITFKQKIVYLIAWLVFGLSSGVMNASTIVFLNDFSAEFALGQNEATMLTCVYFMTSSWASLFLFKLRQHFGVHFFMQLIFVGLCALLGIRLCFHSYLTELLARAGSGTLCISMCIASIFYAGSFLPAHKRIMMLLLGLGLMQLGMPLARFISPFIGQNGMGLDNLLTLENSLCVICLCLMKLAPLPPSFKTPSFDALNIISISLFALAAMLMCFSFSFASVLWWDNALLWASLLLGFSLFAVMIYLEYHRKHPLLNIRFLTKFELLKVVCIAALMRMFLAEQNISTTGFFINSLGFEPKNMLVLYSAILAGAISGLVVCYHTLKGFNRFKLLVWIAFGILCLGSYLSTNLSVYSRPIDAALPQFLITFASVYFLAPLMIDGMLKSFVRGSAYLVSFAAVFSFAQNVFGLLGSAGINYYLSYKIKYFMQHFLASLSSAPSSYELALIKKLAAASAYNEMFYLVFLITLFTTVLLFAEWLFLKIKNINIHSRELALLGAKMQKRHMQTEAILKAQSAQNEVANDAPNKPANV